MKILVVHSRYSNGSLSGENNVVRRQVEALQASGHTVELFEFQSANHRYSFPQNLRAALRVATGFGRNPLKKINQFKPDIIQVHNLFPNFGTRWLRKVNVPVFATVHNFRVFCASGTLNRQGKNCFRCVTNGPQNALRYKCYKNSVAATLPLSISQKLQPRGKYLSIPGLNVIFLSDFVRETFTSLGFKPAKSAVLPNFVNPSFNEQETGRTSKWVCAARLSPEKGVVELIRQWPVDGPQLEIHGDGPLFGKAKAGLKSNVTLMGHSSPEELEIAVSNATGVVVPSLCIEGAVPLAAIEAMALGKPIICLPNNACADFVSSRKVGLVVDSLESLDTAIGEINKNWNDYSIRAKAAYKAEFTREVWLASMEELITANASSPN